MKSFLGVALLLIVPVAAGFAQGVAGPEVSVHSSLDADGNPDPMAEMESMEAMDHWMTMVHGYAFLDANRQGGPSGGRELESQNHLMLMALKTSLGGKLSLLGTFTLEPATIPAAGSRELFQRGETYHNVLLVDRQHPHDLFVQLAAAWESTPGAAGRFRLYAAPIGEPALGPVAYPHRLSASENPTAPLAHHSQDSTHIAADVVSAGWKYTIFEIEGSAFHGREPDENRWDIEQGALDSYSARLWIRPTPELSFQASVGHLEHPEKIEPGNQTRATASIAYQTALPGGFFAATAIAGRNGTPSGPEWGKTLEWTWKFADANFVYGRVESVDRDVFELTHKRQRPEDVPGRRTSVQAGTLGYVRDLARIAGGETGIGLDATVYRFTRRLEPAYGGHPISVHGFLRIRFGSHGKTGQSEHDHMKM